MIKNFAYTLLIVPFLLIACNTNSDTTKNEDQNQNTSVNETEKQYDYKDFELTADLSELTDNERQMIKIFEQVSKYMDTLFFYQAYGDYKILETISDDELKQKILVNFGPWDRFEANKPLLDGIGEKPLGANFYPKEITKKEIDEFEDSLKLCHYTFLRKDENGKLYTLKYSEQFKKYNEKIAELLNKAAGLTNSKAFAKYLQMRAKAFLTDNYKESDLAWLEMDGNKLDFIVGPISVYEDKFLNKKAEHQSYVLIKNEEWTNRMAKYDKWLPFLQKAIPVAEEYRKEEPGHQSKIYVYDALYYGGSGKAGGATFSLIYPLETETQMKNGVRNLQFKNVIEGKFEQIAKPISELIFVKEQKDFIKKDAFFTNVILYEIANSLGVRKTIDGSQTVREALKESFTVSDIVKNYVLSLFLAEKLFEVEEIQNDLQENYITFVANTVRVLRFGIADEYATANLICFNYYHKNGAINFTNENKISVDYEKMRELTSDFINTIITFQGDGDYETAKKFVEEYSQIPENLQKIIDQTNKTDIPKDIIFKQ